MVKKLSKTAEEIDCKLQGAVFEVYVTSSTTATLTLADTYYTLQGAALQSRFLNEFTFNPTTGELTYTWDCTKIIRFVGNATISINDASNRVTFGLFKNWVVQPGNETPTDFNIIDFAKDIGINALLQVSTGDVLTVRAKCDEPWHTLTIAAFHISSLA